MALQQAGVQMIAAGAGPFVNNITAGENSVIKFTQVIRQSASTADQSGGRFSAFGEVVTGALRRVGEIGVNAMIGLGQSIAGAAGEALTAYASYERLGSSLQSLVAREIVSSGGAKDLASAQGLAAGKAQELLGWVQQLAVQSPFEQEQVAKAFKTATAYGFVANSALTLQEQQKQGVITSQRLTQAMIDFASGSGADAYAMDRIALALGQIKARGKLAGGEVLQLVEAGIPVRDILAKAFGTTTDKVVEMQEKGLIPADKAINAIVTSLEQDFGGAAARQAGTFSGLISSLNDIKTVGLREFFTGTFQAIQPYLNTFVSTLSSPEMLANIKNIGTQVGTFVAQMIPQIITFGTQFVTSIQEIATWVQGTLIPALTQVWSFISANILPIGTGLAYLVAQALVPAVSAFGVTLLTVTIPALVATVSAMLPIIVTAAAIVAGVALLKAAWESDFGGIRTAVTQFWEQTAKPAFEELQRWLSDNIPKAVQAASDFFNNVLVPAGKQVWSFIQTQLLPIIEDLVEWLIANIPPAVQSAADFFNNTLLPALNDIWSFIQNSVIPLLESLANVLSAIVGKAVEALAGLWQNVLQPALEDIWSFIQDSLIPTLNNIVTKAIDIITPGINSFKTTVLDPLVGVFNSIGGAIDGVIGWLNSLATSISNIQLPDWLTPGSPTPFEIGLWGINKALAEFSGSQIPDVRRALDDLALAESRRIATPIPAGLAAGYATTTTVTNTKAYNLTLAGQYNPDRVSYNFAVMEALG